MAGNGRPKGIPNPYRDVRRPLHPLVNMLKYFRILERVTQEELCRRAGYSRDALGSVEHGRVQPRLTTYYDLVNALGYEIIIRKKRQP